MSHTKVHTYWEMKTGSAATIGSAELMKADIIAIGCRGLKGIKGMLGSVSRNILIHGKSSVLIGKAIQP